MSRRIEFLDGDRTRACDLEHRDGAWTVSLDGGDPVVIEPAADGALDLMVDGRRRRAWVARRDGERLVFLDGRVHAFRLPGDDDEDVAESGAAGPRVTAEMPGKVVKVTAAVGDAVAVGAPLLILEAMKMEQELTAPVAGRVAVVHAEAGRTVAMGELLVEIEPEDAAS